VALLAVAGAAASAKSSLATVESVFTWSALAAATVRYATPLLFGALGGVVSESGGVINVGLEGMMLMGCFWGVYGADVLGWWGWGLLVAMVSGGLLALLHGVFSIHLRANQIVSGMGITTSSRSGSPATSWSTTTGRTEPRSTSRRCQTSSFR
jgi:general nucleoside transport system permease protein